MTIGIIVKLKIIQIDHCNSGNHLSLLKLVFVIASVICSCQCVHIQFPVISDQLLEHLISAILIYQNVSIKLIYQFNHIGDTLYFNIPGYYLKNISVYKFKFCFFVFFCKGRPGDAVITAGAFVPECIAFASFCHICTSLYSACTQFLFIQEAHNGKYLLQFLQHDFPFMFRHFIFLLCFHGILSIRVLSYNSYKGIL